MKQYFKTPIDQIKVAVCMDIGDGSCTAFAIKLDAPVRHGFDPIPLALNEKGDHEIQSALYYYPNGSVDIGYKDVSSEAGIECVSNFKRCPPWGLAKEDWLSDNLSMISPKPFRDNMETFIAKLWENIYTQASVDAGVLKGLSKEQIAVYVGCPSSESWNLPSQKSQYKALIQKATGMPNVAVVPESTAGICRTIREFGTTVDLSDRIAVLDFGSSTLDLTYIENGRIAAEKSWTLGAYKIEYQMFYKICEVLIEQTQAELDHFSNMDDIPNKGLLVYLEERKERLLNRLEWLNNAMINSPSGSLLLDIRKKAKETYYDKRKEGGEISFPYSLLDMPAITIDDSFMDEVVKKTPLEDIEEGGDSKHTVETEDSSWYGYCKAILMDIKENHIGNHPIRLIVTGGAGRMDFIRPLCKEVFGANLKDSIPNDPAPQNCVSYGLCQVAFNDKRINDTINRAQHYFSEKEEFSNVCAVCTDICADLRSYLFDCFSRIVDDEKRGITQTGILNDMSFQDFKRKVDEQMRRRVKEADLYTIVSRHKQAFEDAMSLKYRKLEEFISNDLYNHSVYIGYRFQLTLTKPCLDKVNFSDGLDIMDFLTEAEKDKMQELAVRNYLNPLGELQMAWQGFKSLVKQVLEIEEPTEDEIIVHPILWEQNIQHHRTEFYGAIFSIMRNTGLPNYHVNWTRDAEKFIANNYVFRKVIRKDIEQIVYGITLQNE